MCTRSFWRVAQAIHGPLRQRATNVNSDHLIKKYANRRLYDGALSRHVTLADIRRFIISGDRVRIVEDRSGEHITRLILLQVLAEQEQFGKPILSVPLLESMIRFYGHDLQDLMAGFLTESLEAFAQQRAGANPLQALLKGEAFDALGELTRQNFAALAKLHETLSAAYTMRAAGERSPTDKANPEA